MYRTAQILACVIAGVASNHTVLAEAPVAAVALNKQDSKATQIDTAALAAKIEELEAKVAYISDLRLIHDVYMHYMRGFDRNDIELLRSAFWPDVQINYGAQSNTFDEFVVRHLNEHTANLKTWGHLITNETVEITGDVAHVESYVTALFTHKDGKPTFANGATIIGVRYIDRLDRRNGEWRIAVREVTGHFSADTTSAWNSSSSKREPPPSDCKWRGTLDKSDPSYRRPLSPRPNKYIGPSCSK